MNKAFVRENDSDATRCPRCQSLGQAVRTETLDAQILPPHRADIAQTGYYCPQADCPVVYFDVFERAVERPHVRSAGYPKDPTAPLCACFGLTEEDVEADLTEGGVTRTRQCVDRAKSPAAHCSTSAASGNSCIAAVQRFYLQRKAEWGL